MLARQEGSTNILQTHVSTNQVIHLPTVDYRWNTIAKCSTERLTMYLGMGLRWSGLTFSFYQIQALPVATEALR